MNRLSSLFKKYFIPHPGNEHKPHFLRHESMALFFLVVIIVELVFLVHVFVLYDKTNFVATVLPGVIANLTNEERTENSVLPLRQNSLLDKAAQLKAEDMASEGYFAHTSPSGKTPWHWFEKVGYQYVYAGENLAVNFFESADVARAWMNSPTHKANIIKPDYTEIGVGVAQGMYESKSTIFVAQLFGTPTTVYQDSTVTKPASIFANQTTQPKNKVADIETPKIIAQKSKVSPKSTAPVLPPSINSVVEVPTIRIGTLEAPTSNQVLGEANSSQATISSAVNRALTFAKIFGQKVLSSPKTYSSYVYGGLFAIISIALLFALFIKSEFRHPKIIARGIGAMAVVVVLLFLNLEIISKSEHLVAKVPTVETQVYPDSSFVAY